MASRRMWLVPIAWVLGTFVGAIQIANAFALFFVSSYSTLSLSDRLFGATSVWQALTSVTILALGLWLVRLRPGWMTFCFFLALLNFASAYTPWPGLPHVLTQTLIIVSVMLTYQALAPLLLVFAVRFPNDEASGWRTAVQYIALACVAGAECFALFDVARHSTFDFLFNSLSAASILLAAVLLLVRYQYVDVGMRARVRWAIAGCIVGLASAASIIFLVAIDNPSAARPSEWLFALLALLSMMLPAFIVYTLARVRFVDPTFVLNRAAVFAITGITLAVTVGACDWAIERGLSETRTALALQAAVTIALGFMLSRLHHVIEGAVERVLFRKRFASSQYLERLGRSLSMATRDAIIEEALTVDVARELDLTSAAAFRYDPERTAYVRGAGIGWAPDDARELTTDDPMVRFLRLSREPLRPYEARWLRPDVPAGIAAPVLALPLVVRTEVAGIVLYGAHRDHTEIDSNEQRDLEQLAERACAALDHVEALTLREALLAARA